MPGQDAMGSADDFARGGSNQGDGQSGEPTFDAGASAGTQDPPGAATADFGAPQGTSGSPTSDLAEERDRYLRLAAEYDNYRKRSAKERQDAGARAQGDLVRQLVEALDDVARFAHVDPPTTD